MALVIWVFGHGVEQKQHTSQRTAWGDALRNAEAEGLKAKRMLRVSNTLCILESLDCG